MAKPSRSSGTITYAAACGAFVLVFAAHYAWMAYHVWGGAMRWASVGETDTSAFARYIGTGSIWLGYTYAVTLAFAAAALADFLRTRAARSGAFAAGGITISGVLAATACFLLGCCGSPMLAVYLNLFGASFIPILKPVIALIATIVVAVSWAVGFKRKGKKTRCSCEHGEAC